MRTLIRHRSLSTAHRGAKAVGDGAITISVDLALEQLQPLLVLFFVGIHFCGSIQTIARFQVITGGIVKLEQLAQRVAIVVLAIGGIEQRHHVFQKLGIGRMLVDDLLQHPHKIAIASRFVFQVAGLAGDFERPAAVASVQQPPYQQRHIERFLVVFFIKPANDRLGIFWTPLHQQRAGIYLLDQLRRIILLGQRLDYSQRGGAIAARNQRVAIGERGIRIIGIEIVSAFEPGMPITLFLLLQLAGLEESGGGRLGIASGLRQFSCCFQIG